MGKNLILSILLFLSAFTVKAQSASMVLAAQTARQKIQPLNLLFIDSLNSRRIFVADINHLSWGFNQIRGINDTLNTRLNPYIRKTVVLDSLSNLRIAINSKASIASLSNYYPISNPNGYISSITGPSVISALGYTPLSNTYIPAWNSISGKPSFSTVAISGSYNDLSDKPTIPNNNNQLVNGAGYLTGEVDPNVPSYSKSLNSFSVIKSSTDLLYKAIGYVPTNSEVIAAIGYVPYNSSNPNGFLTNITSGQVTVALGYTPYPNSNPNAYISSYTETDPLFDTKFSGKSTSNLSEGSNLYYTNTRTRGAISLTTTGVSGPATYNSTTGVLNIPQYISSTPTTNTNVNRTLNSNFTISATTEAFVKYDITLSVTNPLLAGTSTADAYLEYSTNSGTTWITVSRSGNSSGVGLAVAIAITNTQTVSLVGYIPANALTRIRTATTGTASVIYVTNSGQERF